VSFGNTAHAAPRHTTRLDSTQRARQALSGGVIPRTSQKRISLVRRWVRRSKLTRTTLPCGRAAFEGAEQVRHTVIPWNSNTTTIFLGYGMFQFATTTGLPKTLVSVCVALAPTQAGMPSPGLAVPDGTNTSAQARSTRSSPERLRTKQMIRGLTRRKEVLNCLMSTVTGTPPDGVPIEVSTALRGTRGRSGVIPERWRRRLLLVVRVELNGRRP
jgi:hypothetical protein